MSSSDSDSEAEAARKARIAIALWEPPAMIEKPKIEAKPVVAKHVVVGFQQPDFREIPKDLDTLMGEDVDREKRDKKQEDVFGASFVLAEQSMTSKVTRDEFYQRYKDQSVLGLRMNAKEREEHHLAQQKGAKMLEKSLSEQIEFCDIPVSADPNVMVVDDDNGGIQIFFGTKTRVKDVQAPEKPKIGLIGQKTRPAAWDIKRSSRIKSDESEDSDSDEERKRKVALAGVVVDFSTNMGFTAHKKDEKKSQNTSMDVDESAPEVIKETKKDKKKDKKEKKDKHKKEKDKKHKKEKKKENSKKRKRESSDSENDDSLG